MLEALSLQAVGHSMGVWDLCGAALLGSAPRLEILGPVCLSVPRLMGGIGEKLRSKCRFQSHVQGKMVLGRFLFLCIQPQP